MIEKKKKVFIGIVVIHVLACVVASIVFHESIHEHMPAEAQGPDMPVWSWPLEIVFVPFRICLAIGGLFWGGRISLAQQPFLDITITYLSVVAIISLAWFVLAKRNKGAR